MQKISTLTRTSLLFPFALVLYEFSVYIANDMIQPGMLIVTQEFGVSSAWVPSSLSAYILGSVLFQWLFGPLSDRNGRRPVMLCGAMFFALSCLAILFSNSIESFLILRMIQGIGLCFISSVGYATVQEVFDEKTAVRLTALMSNVALIAPLLGPLLGAVMIEILPWRSVFLLIATMTLIAWIGLYRTMPETVSFQSKTGILSDIVRDYSAVLTHREFLLTAFSLGLLTAPLLGWVALSPLILIEDAGMSVVSYGIWQLPVFALLIIGNLILARQANRWRLGASVIVGWWCVVLGVCLMVLGELLQHDTPYFLIAGVGVTSLGEGLSAAVLVRFALTATEVSKGTVAAALGMITMMIYGIAIEGFKLVYHAGGMLGFAVLIGCLVAFYLWLSYGVVRHAMAKRVYTSNE